MENNLLMCEKCFKPLNSLEISEKDFENYHLRIIEEKIVNKPAGTGTPKFNLSLWECSCSDQRKIISIA